MRLAWIGMLGVTLLAAACVADTVGLDGLDRVTIEPDRIDFDGPGVPCGAYTRPITITNGTDVDLLINTITMEGGEASPFRVDGHTPDMKIGPRETSVFELTFAATVDGLYEDRVVITAELAGMRFVRHVVVRGLISANGRHADDFVQNQTGDADILFIIDNSCSMLPEQAALRRSFGSFIQIADSGLLDYHIAVTTTDVSVGDVSAEGRFVPIEGTPADRIVSRRSLPTADNHFARVSDVGTDGSGEERGIHAAYLATTPPLLELPNAGFLRDHALLSVIFVSDEEDQSPDDLDFYAAHLASLKKNDRSRVSVSAIVGDVPGGCTGTGGTAAAATRYIELVDGFGGVAESICTDDWAHALSRLSSVAFGLRASFPLSARAMREDINVTVNRNAVPRTDNLGRTFWRYEPRTNAVVFEPRGIPGPGASVHIEYQTACFF